MLKYFHHPISRLLVFEGFICILCYIYSIKAMYQLNMQGEKLLKKKKVRCPNGLGPDPELGPLNRKPPK